MLSSTGFGKQRACLRARYLTHMAPHPHHADVMLIEVFWRRPWRHGVHRCLVLSEHGIDEPAQSIVEQEMPEVALPTRDLAQSPDVDPRMTVANRGHIENDPHEAARPGRGRQRDLDTGIIIGVAVDHLHPVEIDAALAFAKHFEAALLALDLDLVVLGPVLLGIRSTMQVWPVHGIAEIVVDVLVVSVPDVVVKHAAPLPRYQLFGKVEGRRQWVLLVAEIGPDRLIVLDDRIAPNEAPPFERTIGHRGHFDDAS